jgi:hypothetical protein
LTHPHAQKTQVQRGLWLRSHGSVEIGSLYQNCVGANNPGIEFKGAQYLTHR